MLLLVMSPNSRNGRRGAKAGNRAYPECYCRFPWQDIPKEWKVNVHLDQKNTRSWRWHERTEQRDFQLLMGRLKFFVS